MNDVPLNKHKITRFIPPDESTRRDKAYRVEDIGAIIGSGCDERTKVMVLLMASTAMRVGALPTLRKMDLTPVPEYNLYKIEVYATSARADRYLTYCTPECRGAIDSYLDYRRRLGETITDKSPVIRELFNTKKPYFIEAPRPATPRIIHLALEKALYKASRSIFTRFVNACCKLTIVKYDKAGRRGYVPLYESRVILCDMMLESVYNAFLEIEVIGIGRFEFPSDITFLRRTLYPDMDRVRAWTQLFAREASKELILDEDGRRALF